MTTAPPNAGARVLIVDDEPDQCETLKQVLEREDLACLALTSPLRALEQVASDDFDVVLMDVGMAELSGLELCKRVLEVRPDLIVIMVTGKGDLETETSAMRTGAFDFLVKPVDARLLVLRAARAIAHRRLRDEVKRLRAATAAPTRGSLIGEDAAMRRVHARIEQLGASDSPVLVCGESGTGKALVARAIHDASARSSGRFVTLQCAEVPQVRHESELFGHARRAFTDGVVQREGSLVQAHGGTLFLDAIDELSLELQLALLHALQTHVVRPVGADHDVPFDARIIAATDRELDDAVARKQFRQDLHQAIKVESVEVPPLRERGNDVLVLARSFLDKHCAKAGRPGLTLSPPVAARLLAYDWSGNVRELESAVERMVALARCDSLTLDDLPEKLRVDRSAPSTAVADRGEAVLTIEELERRYIERVLESVSDDQVRAAELLGLDQRTLRRKLGGSDEERGNLSQPGVPLRKARRGGRLRKKRRRAQRRPVTS